ncbi:succinate dehydrogenase, cytochrome b556 subunit [Magnetospira sp. QH-2]|uniref:succinate dehydrogenase, cytochrome b556 subunit n=1 Tax=Magnetospira sp. (strain QH-2) TaxID=1288970 RepID=UPI0003E80C44|nr:succinate dehydrogenase, cytochrome b556 subunit [Magnetospira sp. QH-2]CCQ75021.1 Succinate dehydrogenase cytochrome b556 subunit [Magnetospira sp. QH-2]
MKTGDRPLSPHLTIYRPQITSILSIAHRGTGFVLAVGTLLFTYWIVAAAYGPEAFETAQWLMGTWFVQLVLLGFTFCLFYHLGNGIRHLAWDVGCCLDLPRHAATGWLVVFFSFGATGLTWALILFS